MPLETVTATASCASEARQAVPLPDMTLREAGYYRAAIGWRCEAEVQTAKRRASDAKLHQAESTLILARALVEQPPPAAEGWSDLEMGAAIGLALVLGALAASAGAYLATR